VDDTCIFEVEFLVIELLTSGINWLRYTCIM